jgi:hypothetical protein
MEMAAPSVTSVIVVALVAGWETGKIRKRSAKEPLAARLICDSGILVAIIGRPVPVAMVGPIKKAGEQRKTFPGINLQWRCGRNL